MLEQKSGEQEFLDGKAYREFNPTQVRLWRGWVPFDLTRCDRFFVGTFATKNDHIPARRIELHFGRATLAYLLDRTNLFISYKYTPPLEDLQRQ